MTRVEQGAAFLDSKNPDWRDKVDCAILDLYSHTNCILGQVYGSYYLGTVALDLDEEANDVVMLGFEAENPSDKNEYANLTEEWKRQINGSNS